MHFAQANETKQQKSRINWNAMTEHTHTHAEFKKNVQQNWIHYGNTRARKFLESHKFGIICDNDKNSLPNNKQRIHFE